MQDESSDKTRSSQTSLSDLPSEPVRSGEKAPFYLKGRRSVHHFDNSLNVITWALEEDIERIKDKRRSH